MKNKYVMNLHIFENDVNIIDRTGAESLIPVQESNEIIQGIITQSAVLQRGRKLPNMTSKQYKMPVLDMLPIAYFVNGDSGQKKTTKMAWDKKFIIAEEIAVIVPIPEAVLDDSEYDIWQKPSRGSLKHSERRLMERFCLVTINRHHGELTL